MVFHQIRTLAFFLLLIPVLSLALVSETIAAAKLQVGTPFPTLFLPSLSDGSPMSMKDFRGRKLVVHIWASWSAGCRKHVPGWHEATQQLESEGKLNVVGIVQEQHSQRTRLFMQWKSMGWPVMVDSLNLLGVSAVPITLFLDEFGIIRSLRPQAEDLGTFLSTTYKAPSGVQTRSLVPNVHELRRKASEDKSQLRPLADASFLWERVPGLSNAIKTYQMVLREFPGDPSVHFRLGVAYRARYESEDRSNGDFEKAVAHWIKALDQDPNQYIWRRRIQQYGPRLDKPYSFYDWVNEARTEIRKRGEVPLPLAVEPGGAEFAEPQQRFDVTRGSETEPDPRGRIVRDDASYIRSQVVAVPNTSRRGSVRVHVSLRPNSSNMAHWNNEVDNLVFWINPPQGWQVDSRHKEVQVPESEVSQETRTVEFELQAPADFVGDATVSTYALYYVCEDINGTCLYRRLDIPVTVSAK